MRPLDTSPEAYQVQLSILQAMAPGERSAIACHLSEFVREMIMQRIRREHPEFSDRQVMAQFIFEVHGVRVDAP